MAEAAEIKKWIQEIRTGKPISEDAILIQVIPNATRITLLNIACCIPALIIPKTMAAIAFEDLRQLQHLINHQH